MKNNWKEFSKLTLAIISRSVLFVGCNTFIPLYWIHNFGQSKAAGAAALTCFCTFGVISNFIGGMLSDRFGYLRIIRLSYVVLIPPSSSSACWTTLCRFRAPAAPRLFLVRALQLNGRARAEISGEEHWFRFRRHPRALPPAWAASSPRSSAGSPTGYGLPRAIQSMTIVAVIGTVAAFLLVSLNRRTD